MDNLFRFKQFSVRNISSAMKVGTDAVLLGTWMEVAGAQRLLDIGTGTGVIALLGAQRRATLDATTPFLIEALDIEANAAREATGNFENSPWASSLQAVHTSLQDWVADPLHHHQYDLIFSNPPYFDQAWKPDQEERRLARHSDTLPFLDLLTGALALLKPGGRLALILPQQEGLQMLELAERTLYQVRWRMEIVRKTAVYTVRRKPARRLLLEFVKSQQPLPLQTDELTIHDKNGDFSADYRALTGDFYLF
ncbi:MAG: methyltransferase [Bacteroidales bacterium]|nr:methyltransferase [Bacteroidales bacterium]